LEDSLAEVAGEEKAVGSSTTKCCEEPELSDADVLRFIDYRPVNAAISASARTAAHNRASRL